MKRLALVPLAVFGLAIVLASSALAKGEEGGAISRATIDGPGIDKVSLPGEGGTGAAQLAQLTDAAFFPAALGPRVLRTYGQVADSRLRVRPQGDLGPRFTITYAMRGPNGRSAQILQDVYPYATLNPVPYLVRGQVVTYMKPGQPLLGSERTVGGWYVATTFLKDVLVAAGLPVTPPAGGDGSQPPWALIGALVGTGLMVALGALLIRRHGHRRTVTA